MEQKHNRQGVELLEPPQRPQKPEEEGQETAPEELRIDEGMGSVLSQKELDADTAIDSIPFQEELDEEGELYRPEEEPEWDDTPLFLSPEEEEPWEEGQAVVHSRRRRHSNMGWKGLAATLMIGVLLGIGVTQGLNAGRITQLKDQLEQQKQKSISKEDLEQLVYQYGTGIPLIQQLFPDRYVYTGANGVTLAKIDPSLPQGNRDWSGLTVDEQNRYQYTAPDGTQARLGIDVSSYCGEIDWQAVKGDGISYAMIRLGFRGYGASGKLVLDTQYEANIQGALAAGVQVGVYFFSQAITVEEAVEEANYVIQALQGYEITYPVVFDMEKIGYDSARADGLSAAQTTQIAQAFCDTVAQAGYTPMIYGNVAWVLDHIQWEQLTQYDLWLAQYLTTPTFPYAFQMWQYSDKGTVAGIEGNVDMNLYFPTVGQVAT